MELERCNSISTVSTLSMITLQPTKKQRKNKGWKRALSLDDIQEVPQSSAAPRIHYQMKPPSKTKRMKKYMILFSVVLLFVVLSTVLAGYVGTKKVVDDIPSIVEKQVEKLPGVESLKISLSNISENQDDFNQDLHDFKNEMILIIEQHFKRLENAKEYDLELIRNETKKTNDFLLEQFMNNTDLLSWKDDFKQIMYNLIHRMYCVDNCTGIQDSNYQSCSTCNGFVSCSGGILTDRRPCAFNNGSPLLWDDHRKTCELHSNTCDPSYIHFKTMGHSEKLQSQ
uniref:Uncharacterized protein LOC111108205 n=1 Tax=Crassostrea virginica TaxID=6565 RepID=A0A8B8B976_CRAVI|nr:uncharacterized protein LOC111108205 [Crassostrea virginica]